MKKTIFLLMIAMMVALLFSAGLAESTEVGTSPDLEPTQVEPPPADNQGSSSPSTPGKCTHSQQEIVTKTGDCQTPTVQYVECIQCGERLDVPGYPKYTPGDHKFGSWQQTKAPTCSKPGTETRTCRLCGLAETRDTDYLAEHDYDHYVDLSSSNCTTPGVRRHTCSVCGAVWDDPLPVQGNHDLDLSKRTVSIRASCTSDGSCYAPCKRCGVIVHYDPNDSSTAALRIPARGHNFDSGQVIRALT